MRKNEAETSDFPYEEVINLGMPERDMYFYLKHPKMPCGKRAKIFAPFAALKGFEEEVDSKEVQYAEKRELSEEECRQINACLVRLSALMKAARFSGRSAVRVRAEYYRICLDEHHPQYRLCGTYETVTDTVKETDPVRRILSLEQIRIPFDDLSGIEILPGTEAQYMGEEEKSYG